MSLRKLFLVIVMMGLAGLGYFSYFVYNVMLVSNTAFSSNQAYLYIRTNSKYEQVREDLIPILKNIETFDILARQKKYIYNVKAGRYVIEKGMTNNDIINTIRSKNTPITISFNNQQSIEQLAKRVSNQIEADSLSLIKVFTDSMFLTSNDFTKENILAMYLPNSYEFFWNTSAKRFRSKLYKAYNKFWNFERREKALKIGMTPVEVSILAAIVQEESKKISEKPKIAGVYINRLKNNWALQADPTLKYAAYKSNDYDGVTIKRVLNIHKKIKSPYNTYLNKGLPPGLIAMPDLSSIDAVLNYEKHSYFYFAANPEKPGFHNFARSLKDHNINAINYQNYLNKKGIKK